MSRCMGCWPNATLFFLKDICPSSVLGGTTEGIQQDPAKHTAFAAHTPQHAAHLTIHMRTSILFTWHTGQPW